MPLWLVNGWAELGITAAKTVLMYLVALLGLRVAHRRTLAQWKAIDVVAAVAIGAIVGRTALARDQTFAVGAVALVTVLGVHWLATLGRSSAWFRRLVDHRVRVLVDHGRLRHDQLRVCGLTESEVFAQLRSQGVDSLDQLRYVLFETKGELTLVREEGAHTSDGEFLQAGLSEAADFPVARPSTAERPDAAHR